MMYPITCKRGSTDVNCPFECPVYREAGGSVEYGRGDCPVADDLYDRAIGIGLNQWYTAADCRNIARGINKVLGAYCTEDPAATPWL
jgi:dTDP-4-amino-4,6-dideoxygalactose transaminase